MQDGLLTPDEVASCSQTQIEFLVRKRTSQGATNSVVPAPPRRVSSSPRPGVQRPPSPAPAANGWGQSPQPQVRAAGQWGWLRCSSVACVLSTLQWPASPQHSTNLGAHSHMREADISALELCSHSAPLLARPHL